MKILLLMIFILPDGNPPVIIDKTKFESVEICNHAGLSLYASIKKYAEKHDIKVAWECLRTKK